MPVNIVSTAIYIVQEGDVSVYAKNMDDGLLNFEPGTYFGDTSFIFKIRNQFEYHLKNENNPYIIYSI